MAWNLDFPATAPAAPHAARPLVTLKDVLWFFYLYPIRILVRSAPRLFGPILIVLGSPAFSVLRRDRAALAASRMDKALGVGEQSAHRMARRFTRNAVIRAVADLRAGEGERARFVGREHLDAALTRGRGVLLLTGHFYAGRIAKRALAPAGYPVMSVRNGAPPDGLAGRIGKRFLQPRYIQFLHGVIRDEVDNNDQGASLAIFRRLRSNGIVNIHFDAAFATDVVEAPFLGAVRRFSLGLLELVRLSGCAVVPMLATGIGGEVRIAFEPALDLAPAASRAEFASLNLPLFIETLERQVRACPEEWELWIRL
jgi:lauroyl/myristoyl acyltransferase